MRLLVDRGEGVRHRAARYSLTPLIAALTVVAPAALAAVAAVPVTPARKQPPIPADHAQRMEKGAALFASAVRPVFVAQCLKCHGGEKKLGGFDLGTREALLTPNAGRVAVVPGNSRDSRLLRLVAHQEQPHMPLGMPKLSTGQIRQIAEWIDLGAPYDKPLVQARGEKKPMVVSDADRKFWSFQPLTHPTAPAVKNQRAVRNPVDRFVLAKLEAKGLAFSPALDPRRLIRRAYFDLIGLPPTPQEVEAFVRECAEETKSGGVGERENGRGFTPTRPVSHSPIQNRLSGVPAAYERLVDRLLASPHYGERWGRHWLDLARFAESHGYEQDYDRPNAYHYRDFVIRALNQDLPYDKFVKWQIAGDEYEPQNPLALAATGFLAAGVHSTQITASQVEKERYDELDDQVRTIGTSMLGLTIGCARCHDHKYDPIPTRDYYRMLATFTRTVRSDYDVQLDPVGDRAARARFEREKQPLVDALKQYEERELSGKLQGWLATRQGEVSAGPWLLPDVEKVESRGGASISPLPDGSFLVGGKNVDNDAFTFTVRTRLSGIRALRLEALSHPSLVKGGPGRADNGNFALSDLRVTAAPVDDPAKAAPVQLVRPRATFEQGGLPVAATIDGNKQTAWAVDPQFGKDHAVVFELAAPVSHPAGTIFTVTLEFNNNVRHSIARPRLSLSTRGELPLTGEPQSEAVQRALASAGPLSPEDRAAVLRWYRTRDAGWQELNRTLEAFLATEPKPRVAKMLICSEGVPAVRTHTQGGDFLEQTHFLKRGDPNQKGEVVTQGFLTLLTRTSEGEKHWQSAPPAGWRTTYQRRALAEWLTDVDQGAGHLLARVIVNRLWQHHFGRGIVGTPSDFGLQGERPSHPELLDYLATELIRNGWKLKPLHKLLMTSAAYRQGAATDPRLAKLDPENRLFGRQAPRRLEAEIIRDAMLSVSGTLDPTQFGPGTLDLAQRRRSLYFFVKRSRLVPSMVLFDAPDTLQGMDRRPTTIVPPQALLLMNNAVFRGYADALAKRADPTGGTPLPQAIRAAYELALSRPPTPRETAEAAQFITAQAADYRQADRPDAASLALGDLCQVLFGLNEFVYVD